MPFSSLRYAGQDQYDHKVFIGANCISTLRFRASDKMLAAKLGYTRDDLHRVTYPNHVAHVIAYYARRAIIAEAFGDVTIAALNAERCTTYINAATGQINRVLGV